MFAFRQCIVRVPSPTWVESESSNTAAVSLPCTSAVSPTVLNQQISCFLLLKAPPNATTVVLIL